MKFIGAMRASIVAAGSILATLSHAADIAPAPVYKAPPPVAASSWVVDITPYFWMPSLSGTSTVKGHATDIDATFFGDLIHREIPKQLFGLMTAFEARKDRFAIIGDFTYLKLGVDKDGSTSKTLGAVVTAGAGASLDTTIKMIVAELAAAYEVAQWQGTAGSKTFLDLYGGGRLWWQQAEASLGMTAAVAAVLPRNTFSVEGSRAVAKSGDVTWVDPLVGLRLRHTFSPGHELTLSGDVGGFGVGSQFSWQAVGAYQWAFARTQSVEWSGLLGYRALYADYSKGSGNTLYEYDMLQHGPIVGINARF